MSTSPREPDATPSAGGGLRVSAWNLILLLPLLVLITPWFNFQRPTLFGLPFFYWYQLAFVVVGVLSVTIVYVMTRDRRDGGRHSATRAQGEQR
ncbi:MAG: DUF3311 domain-containing protein [Sciscionella sp.]